jgi:hypothetical protein
MIVDSRIFMGAFWAQAYFEERPNFGRKGLILEKNNWHEKHMWVVV